MGAADAYEGLRPALLDPSVRQGSITGRVMLLRRGMVAWIHAREMTPAMPPALGSLGAAAVGPGSSDVTAALVQLMADLVLSHHKEPGDA
jgi:hypothetical protein